jgi:uncharacterized protein
MSYTDTTFVDVYSLNSEDRAIRAKTFVPKDTLLGFFDGKAMLIDLDRKSELDDFWWRQSVHLKLIGSKLLCYLPTEEPDGIDFLNHSCRANTRVVDQIYVFADRDIQPGEDLTADYRTFNLVPEGKKCWCAVPLCEI